MDRVVKVGLAVLNTLLAAFVDFVLFGSFLPRNGDILSVAFASLLVVGVVAGWVVALKQAGTVSIWWKILSFAVLVALLLASGL